jgi:hypothetical protein
MEKGKTYTKPRLGESGDELWKAIKRTSNGVVCEGRIIYPTLRVVAGESFFLGTDGKLQRVVGETNGFCYQPATAREVDEFHHDLNQDRVEVLLMTQPGWCSNYERQKVLRILHSPSGMAFGRD